jgi:septal ring factor EnvC (AmiA/AmiB activator)
MKKPGRFNLLIVHDNGSRVLRLNFPRWVLYGAVLLLALGVSFMGVIFGDYLSLKKQWGEMAALQKQVADQRGLIDSFHRRISEVRGEIATWRDLHARIWEPLGPEERASWKGSGVGGGTEPVPQAAAGRAALATELDRLGASVNEEGQSLRALEQFMARAGKMLAALPSRWPVRGPVNSEYGRRLSPWSGSQEFHSGIDIGSDRGTSVKAPSPGIVVFTGSNADYGNTVIIDHGQDIKTLYGHLQKVLVAQGQRIERGQTIALIGNTGKSSGPHLHYEIQVRGQPINPRGFLWN